MGGMGGMGGGGRANSSGGNSPHETTGRVISGNRVTITYGRPSAKGREIWGKLVPWDKAWRLGSDEATTMIIQKPIAFGDLTVPAGAYTLYMVPSESGTSKLVISKKIGAWGIPVDETQDLGRVDLKKDATPAPVEELTITVGSESGGGVIKISWENAVYSVSFANK
jgi:hypothetical protein